MNIKVLSLMFSLISINQAFGNLEYNGTDVPGHHRDGEVLSRRKRFLVFPEGSSFQLVFCATTPVITPIGDVFLLGYTAALAYELPQDPYSPFRHKADPLHRREDNKMIYYTDDDGKVIYKAPYRRKPIVNPAFAKRSVDDSFVKVQFKKGTGERLKKIDRMQMHASQHKREFLKSTDGYSVEFHRSGRARLYSKIESLVDGLGGNGRQCVLKTLCLVGQSQNTSQGTFLEEMMRLVFTLPKGKSEDIDDLEYDEAHNSTESCEKLYPDCIDPLPGTYHSNVIQ